MPCATINGSTFNYVLDDFTDPWNPGPLVVFHHGYARNHHFWYEWVPLIGQRYRCLRFDIRGHGSSDPLGADFEPTLEQLADDVVGLLDHLGVERAHFVGESLGGLVGMSLGAHHEERIESLVLLSTPVKVSDQGRADFSAGASSWESVFDTVAPAEWARQTMGHRFDLETTSENYIDWAVEQAAATPVESLRKYARLIEAVDLSAGIPAVTPPTLLVAGGSKLAPPEQARFLRDRIPRSQLELIPQARHLVGYAMPARCAQLSQAFWAELPG
jgi:pimeloyl-ACP methyl ester carboxylesterase